MTYLSTAPSLILRKIAVFYQQYTVATAVMSTHHSVALFVIVVLLAPTIRQKNHKENVPNGSEAMRNIYTDVCGDEAAELYNGHVTCSDGTVTVDRMFCLTHNCSNISLYIYIKL